VAWKPLRFCLQSRVFWTQGAVFTARHLYGSFKTKHLRKSSMLEPFLSLESFLPFPIMFRQAMLSRFVIKANLYFFLIEFIHSYIFPTHERIIGSYK
jgi:hypothetical protein